MLERCNVIYEKILPENLKVYYNILNKQLKWDNINKKFINLNIDSVFNRLEIDDDEFKYVASLLGDELFELVMKI